MKTKYLVLSFLFVVVLAVICSTRLSSNSAYVAAGYVNDPVSPNSCATSGCHSGGTLLNQSTYLTLEIADSADYANSVLHPMNGFQYSPNTSYWISFSLQHLVYSNYNGFQMTAMNSVNDSMAGAFTVIDTGNTWISTAANNRQYIGHRHAGGDTSWAFKWNAAQDTNAVTFYYTYVCASQNTGAQPYTFQGTVSMNSAVSTILPHVSLGNDQTITRFDSVIELRATTFGGTAPYQYMWHTNPNTSNPLSCDICDSAAMTVSFSANISVTVTDAHNHTASATVNVTLDTTSPAPPQSLCAVTCDSATGQNVVLWNPATGVDSFFIYRSDAGSASQQIAALPGNANGVYYDASAQPGSISYQYEINLKDNSGKYDSLSPDIQTIYLEYLGSGVLQWTPYKVGTDSAISNNYVIYRDSTGSGNWDSMAAVGTAQLTVTDANYNSVPHARYKVTEAITACNLTPSLTEVASNVVNLIPTGISKVSPNFIRLYPNPASTQVAINLNGFEARNITIYNQLGQQVKSVIPLGNSISVIDVSSFGPGIYLVSARTTDEVFNTTLVVSGK